MAEAKLGDTEAMVRAIDAAHRARCASSPNPWVGCVIGSSSGALYEGATREPGREHAEIVALQQAAADAQGATLYVTLEPCSHHGRTPPCTDAIIDAGVRRVVIGVEDPDPRVAGDGIETLRDAGLEVEVGLMAHRVEAQLAPYFKHRRTGTPYVVLKLAASLDGGTAAPDGSSQWITSPEARADGHRLRAESDAIVIGAGTVREDDPSLTVREYRPPQLPGGGSLDPLRVVLGSAPPDARVRPCLEMKGDLEQILQELGGQGVVQVLVEGGASVAGAFHRAGLVDRYVIYLAPALFGGDDMRGLFRGPGVFAVDDLWRGQFVGIERVGPDLRVEIEPTLDLSIDEVA